MKTEHNPENEIVKKRCLDWLHGAKECSIKTVDGVRKAILRYEEFTNFDSFKGFNADKAADFKKHLFECKNKHGEPLSLSIIHHTLKPLQDFLQELSKEAGYRRKILPRDVEYLNLANNDRRKLQTGREVKVHPTIEQAQRALQFNPKMMWK
jgi:hypothetical protein